MINREDVLKKPINQLTDAEWAVAQNAPKVGRQENSSNLSNLWTLCLDAALRDNKNLATARPVAEKNFRELRAKIGSGKPDWNGIREFLCVPSNQKVKTTR